MIYWYRLLIQRINYIIYPLVYNSTEARRIIRAISSDNLLFPCFLFIHIKRNQNTLTRSSVIDKLEGNISVDILRDAMIKNIEVKERAEVNNTTSSTADLINQQKQELEHLEKLEQQRKREEQDRIKREREEKLRAEKEVK